MAVLAFDVGEVQRIIEGELKPAPDPEKKPEPEKKDPQPKDGVTKAPKPAAPTRAEILAKIKAAGESNPDWWDSVKLDYPRTLNLRWERSGKGWQPKRNLGAYIYSVIHPHPKKWRGGIRTPYRTASV